MYLRKLRENSFLKQTAIYCYYYEKLRLYRVIEKNLTFVGHGRKR